MSQTTKTAQLAQKSSRKARISAARLAAVQAVYQMMKNDQSARAVIEEYVSHRLGQPVEGQDMIVPDGRHFSATVGGVADRLDDLESLLSGAIAHGRDDAGKAADGSFSGRNDPLLHALLLCGAYELLAMHDIDAPIIISDYIHVAHAFFEKGEARFVNGVLDRIGKSVRS